MADKKITNGKLLGVDIGTSSIKIAEVTCDQDGMVVTALGEAPMPEDLYVNEDIQNVRQLASIIKKLCKDCGTTCKKAAVSISATSNILTRTLEVPKSDSAKQTKLSVKYEVERLFPHSSFDTEFDYVELPSRKSSETATDVFVVASYRKLVEDVLNLTKMAGLQLDAIEVGDLTMGRSLIDLVEAEGEPICGILDIGATKSVMSVFDGTTIKNPGMIISVSGNTFTKVISDTMGTSIQEAEEFKKDYVMVNQEIVKEYYDKKYSNDFEFDSNSFDTAFDDPNYNPAYSGDRDNGMEENPFEFDGNAPEETVEEPETEVNQEDTNFNFQEQNKELEDTIAEKSGVRFNLDDMEAETDATGKMEQAATRKVDPEKSDDVCRMICEQLENLQNEIRSQLDEYYNTTGVNVQKLILTGGTSKMPGLDEFLSEYLGIDVVKGNPRDIIKFRISGSNMNIMDDLNSVYPVAIGLAMRDFIE